MTEQDIMNFCIEHNVTLNFEYDRSNGLAIKMKRDKFYRYYFIRKEEMSYSLKHALLCMLHDLDISFPITTIRKNNMAYNERDGLSCVTELQGDTT